MDSKFLMWNLVLTLIILGLANVNPSGIRESLCDFHTLTQIHILTVFCMWIAVTAFMTTLILLIEKNENLC